LNNPLKHTDPSGMRPPTKWEQQALDKLDDLAEQAKKDGNTDLANGFIQAKNEISKIIDALKNNQSDFGVQVAAFAINNIGNAGFGDASSHKIDDQKGNIVSINTGQNKCNIFVAAAYIYAGLRFTENGKGGFPLMNGKIPVANWLGDSKDRMNLTNLPIITNGMRPGDIVAWRTEGGASAGHSSINIGGGVLVYAGGPNGGIPKANTFANADSNLRPSSFGRVLVYTAHDSAVVRRFN
jgi:hypothetical protein